MGDLLCDFIGSSKTISADELTAVLSLAKIDGK